MRFTLKNPADKTNDELARDHRFPYYKSSLDGYTRKALVHRWLGDVAAGKYRSFSDDIDLTMVYKHLIDCYWFNDPVLITNYRLIHLNAYNITDYNDRILALHIHQSDHVSFNWLLKSIVPSFPKAEAQENQLLQDDVTGKEYSYSTFEYDAYSVMRDAEGVIRSEMDNENTFPTFFLFVESTSYMSILNKHCAFLMAEVQLNNQTITDNPCDLFV